jgi:hypothetical protein
MAREDPPRGVGEVRIAADGHPRPARYMSAESLATSIDKKSTLLEVNAADRGGMPGIRGRRLLLVTATDDVDCLSHLLAAKDPLQTFLLLE